MNINHYYKVEEIIKYISENHIENPTLDDLSKKFNYDSFYLQKLFTEWVGISPKKFIQYLNLNYLKTKIFESPNLDSLSSEVGLSSQSRVYDLFVNFEAVTPNEYKTNGQNIKIEYGIHDTLFGKALIAVSERGITNLSFLNDDKNIKNEISELHKMWFKSEIVENRSKTEKYIQEIFKNNTNTKLFLKGTQFQLKVWDALLKIPEGNLTTYEEIAKMVGNPKACRAVGSAVGSNNISYLIPCHRVIRKEISIGNYRWGSDRKKLMICYEMSKRI